MVKRLVAPALSGVLFAMGLGLAGMTDPAKVLAFLDVTGQWDPSLAFVMGGAMATYSLARWRILRRAAPIGGGSFPPVPRARPDRRLVAGAALFGVGWGLSGWCPGPAIASVGVGGAQLVVFMAAMVAGMGLFQLFEQRDFLGSIGTQEATPNVLSTGAASRQEQP